MDLNNIQTKIKQFLEADTKREIKDYSINLIDAGILDSFGIIKLITFIEHEFSISVDIDSMDEESFSSINSLAEHIHKWEKK